MGKRILAINPGSTSTKVAIFDGKEEIFNKTVRYSKEELEPFKKVFDQLDFREKGIEDMLKEQKIDLHTIDVIVGRGGYMKPIPSGVYEINSSMMEDLKNAPVEHASNLGAIIADSLAKEVGVKAYVVDPIVVDELEPLARISGSALIERNSVFHALNQKAIGRRYAAEHNTRYEDLNLIIAHMGGGVSVGLHKKGKVADTTNALYGEGTFSSERSGALPIIKVIKLCYSGKYTYSQIVKLLNGEGGIMSYMGTNSFTDVAQGYHKGDKKCIFMAEAIAYQVSKDIASMASVACGDVDSIIITGGMAYNEFLVDLIRKRVGFIAPVERYPGEDEMGALASGVLRILSGEEKSRQY